MTKHYVPVKSPFANEPLWFVGPFVSKAAAQKWLELLAKDKMVKIWPDLPTAREYRWVVFKPMSIKQIQDVYELAIDEIDYRTLPAETIPTVKDLRQASREWKAKNRK